MEADYAVTIHIVTLLLAANRIDMPAELLLHSLVQVCSTLPGR